MNLVFVYGTLKEGKSNNSLLKDSKKITDDMVDGRIYSLGGFPGLKHEAGTVYGEVYEVDDETLARMDHLEGHPKFYTREPITTQRGVICWCYFYNHDVHKRHQITSGVW